MLPGGTSPRQRALLAPDLHPELPALPAVRAQKIAACPGARSQHKPGAFGARQHRLQKAPNQRPAGRVRLGNALFKSGLAAQAPSEVPSFKFSSRSSRCRLSPLCSDGSAAKSHAPRWDGKLSACSPLPGFEPQSSTESKAHTQLRRPHPRGRLKAHRPQPRGKASVRAPPRSPAAPPGRTARDGAEALEQPRGRRADAGTAALPLPAATGRSRPPSGPPLFSAPGPAARQRNEAAAAPTDRPQRRAAPPLPAPPIPAAAGPAPPRPAVGGPAFTSRAGSGAGDGASLHLPPLPPVPSRRPPLLPPLARRRHGQLGGAVAQALLRPSAGGPARSAIPPEVASAVRSRGRPSAPTGAGLGRRGAGHFPAG